MRDMMDNIALNDVKAALADLNDYNYDARLDVSIRNGNGHEFQPGGRAWQIYVRVSDNFIHDLRDALTCELYRLEREERLKKERETQFRQSCSVEK